MTFLEAPRFPEGIAYGATFGPGYSTDIVPMASGYEQTNQNWDGSLMGGDVSHGVKSPADMAILNTFFRIAKGRAKGWRFKDLTDYTVTIAAANGYLGTTALGTGLAPYKLYKHYSNTGGSENRRIMKPVSGQVFVYRGGVLVTVGAAAGNVAIDTTTGLITFVADISKTISAVTKANPGKVTTSTNHGFSNGQQIYHSGVGGMIQLNGNVYTITVTAVNQYTIGVDTTGYTTFTAGGTAAKFPQTSEALLWEGEFDVPCRFDIDQMRPSAETLNASTWGPFPIVEKRLVDT